MNKLWAKFYLWWNDVCTKHFEPKEVVCSEGGCYTFCQQCEDEEKERKRVNLVSAMMTLKK